MADMIKFYKGLEASLPTTGVNGALYVTTDEGAIYLGTGTGMKRLGDFVQVADVASLPAKAHESCLYYCVAENILAKWNGAEWKQINKQPTAEELKGLLGLGTMAYKSEVAESDLNAALAEKVNAAAEGNHSHSNKGVLDGITADKVTAWDSAETNAKAHADTLNTNMNTRVEALEAIDHDHSNKAELDLIVSGDKAKWDTAAGKAHEHANADELAKIADGDKARWDAVAADHLTSADKTTLENAIKDAKKAGTDANTALESYKVTNDAAIDAIEEDIAEITNADNGILAQAKSYSDGKLDAAKTAISAEIDADVKVVADDLAGYKTSNDNALAGVKATADAAATKEYTDAELAKKVDKVTGKSLVDDAEIAKLAGVSAGANKVELSDNNGSIKIDGVETVVYTHPDKHTVAEISDFDASVKAYDYATKTEAQAMADAKDDAIAEAKAAGTGAKTYAEGVAGNLATHISEADGKYETKTDASAKLTEAKGYTDTEVAKVQGEVDALDEYVGDIPEGYTETTVIAYINKKAEETLAAASGNSTETAASVKAQLDSYKSENDTRVKAAEDAIDAIEADYLKKADKDELEGKITAEADRAKGVESGLDTRVKAIEDDYLKAADKEALQAQINTIMNNPDAEGAINSINEFTQYVKDHGTIADGFRTDIDQNKEDIAAINNESTGILKQAKDYADSLADNYAEADHDHVVADITDFDEKVKAYNYATIAYADQAEADAKAYADGIKSDLQDEIDADVKALADGAVATNASNIAKNAEDIANKANAADVYAKTETYTKAEVDAAVAEAVTAATEWGSF